MKEKNNISQELFETIERYLNQTMDLKERASFDQQLISNATLRQQVSETEILLKGVRKAVLKKKLDSFHEDLSSDTRLKKQSKVFKLNFRTLSIAASFLLLFGGFWFFNQQPNNQQLFEQHFTPDRGLATVMSGTDNYAFDDAMVDYKNQKYKLAIQKWEALLKSKPENDTLIYFLGVAQLANMNENEAIEYLQKVVNQKQSTFEADAYFYLGLAHLKEENSEAALKNLQKNNSPKSKEIISELTN